MKKILGLFAMLILAACSGMEGYSVRSGFGAGLSTVRAENDDLSDESLKLKGRHGKITAELAAPVNYFEHAEVGVRLGAVSRTTDWSDDASTVDLSSTDLQVAPVVRGYLPLTDDGGIKLYGEAFGGYSHTIGTVDVASPFLTGGKKSDDAAGGFFGGGLGLEFMASKRGSAILGVEWSRSLHSLKQFESSADDVTFMLGWKTSF